MPSSLVVQPALLSLEALALGRFIVDPNNPLFDFIDPKADIRPKSIVGPRQDFASAVESESAIKLKSSLLSLLGVNFEKTVKVDHEVAGTQELEYRIENVQAWFNEACSLSSVRTWLEGVVGRNRKAYLVSGYRTITNARMKRETHTANVVDSNLQATGAVIAATGIPLPASLAPLDAGVNFGRAERETQKAQYSTEGEHIYAVEYYQVRFKWFSSKSVEKSFLAEKNVWKPYWSMRGQEDNEDENSDDGDDADEADEEDAVEVNLSETLELDGCSQKFSTRDGQIDFLLFT